MGLKPFLALAIASVFLVSGCIQTGQTQESKTMEAFRTITSSNNTVAKYKGLWLPFLREVRISLNDIENLKKDGVNIVSIGIKICQSNNIISECENESEIKNSIEEFHRNGIHTFLVLNPAHPDSGIKKTRNFLPSLTPLVLKWARIAEDYGVWMFAPLNEPQLIAQDRDVSEWAQSILPEIRRIYSGKIGFRVHGVNETASLYNLTGYDYVIFSGLAATQDIKEHPEWLANLVSETLNKVETAYPGQKHIAFDIGAFTGPDYYWWEPVAPENVLQEIPGIPSSDFFTLSNESQAKFFDMFFNLTWDRTEGYFIPVYKGWEYRGKPAEQIIRQWFNPD